jgi:hypothetical protein
MQPANLFLAAQRVLLALNRTGVVYGLCGGIAVGVHGVPRATKDIDVLIASEKDLEKIDAALSADGWFNSGAAITFPDGITLHRRLLAIDNEVIILDLLIQPQGMDLLSDRMLSDLQGAAGWVISKKSLRTMKTLAGRPQDLFDLAKMDEFGD